MLGRQLAASLSNSRRSAARRNPAMRQHSAAKLARSAKPSMRAIRSIASASVGQIWVCSSATIWMPCSTRRRNQYAAVSASRAWRDPVACGEHIQRIERRAHRAIRGTARRRSTAASATKNSISRMPPRPSLTLWPSTAISPCPCAAWICRLIDGRRQSPRSPDICARHRAQSPRSRSRRPSRSPAHGRALIMAARSQFRPSRS